MALDGPDAAVALGLGLMAQDRRDGLIGEQSVADNIGIASLGRIIRHGMLDVVAGRRQALDQVAALGIKTASIDAEVRTLSGGNQQKVQIARWLAADARILIMIDPTRGVDVGARREIKRIWAELGATRLRHPARLDRRGGAGRRLRPGGGDGARARGRRGRRRRADRAEPAQDGDRWLSSDVTAEAPLPAAAAIAAPVRAACRRCATRCCSSCWPRSGPFFFVATDGTFLTQRNLVLLALQTSIVSLAAISAVMLIVTRNFDLSVGSAVAFVGVILALLTVKHDVNPWLGVARRRRRRRG